MNFNKIFISIVVVVIIVLGFIYFKNNKTTMPPANTQPQTTDTTPPADTAPIGNIATIETSLGTFEVTLDAKAAPLTVTNFIKLADSGFYDSLIFHRIIAGFMIQGGDPKGDGTGGPGYTVPAEIGLKHTAGAIAMARTGDAVNPTRASSGSQFYITLAPQTSLDGQYTVFGYVTSGMDVVTKIGHVPVSVNSATGEQSVPVTPVIIKNITIK